jgi:hypothetical protein
MRRTHGLSVIEVLIAVGVLAILISVFSLTVRAVVGGAGQAVSGVYVERTMAWEAPLVFMTRIAAA